MAWTTTFAPDSDTQDVGGATTVWNAGLPDEFTFSKRILADTPGIAKFKKDAEAALVLRDATLAKGVTIAATITTEMNKAAI